jgi:hypothetical protein
VGDSTPLSMSFGSHHFGWKANYVYDACLTIYCIGDESTIYPYNMHYNTYEYALIQSGSLSYDDPVTTEIAHKP